MKHTCSGCSRTWTGFSMAHCGSCHTHTFSGVTAFDRHRQRGQCLDPGKVFKTEEDGSKTPVYELRTSGPEPIWAFPADPDFNERFGRVSSIA